MVSSNNRFCLLVSSMSISMNYFQRILAHSSILMIICLATQDRIFTALEDTLNEDINKVAVFLSKRRFQPNVPIVLFRAFHFHNATASQDSNVQLNGQPSVKVDTRYYYVRAMKKIK